MTDVIDFLERMGQDAQLRHASQDEVELALTSAEIVPEMREAILAKDQAQLEMLLGQIPQCGVFFPSKEDEEQDDDSEGTEETPSRKPDENPERTGHRIVMPAG
jgi:hypothetical protein